MKYFITLLLAFLFAALIDEATHINQLQEENESLRIQLVSTQHDLGACRGTFPHGQ